MKTHRNVKPATYNSRRLKETPKPSLASHGDLLEKFCTSGNVYESNSDWEFDDSIEESSNDNNDANLNVSECATNSHDLSVVDDRIDIHSNIDVNESTSSVNSLNETETEPVEEIIQTSQNVSVNSDDANDQLASGTDPLASNGTNNQLTSDADPLALDTDTIAVNSTASTAANNANLCDSEPTANQNMNETGNDSTIDSVNIANVQVKVEQVPLYEIYASNREEVYVLLDEPDETRYYDSDEDLTMIVPENGIPMPLGATEDNIIKRERDSISGNIPFNVMVSIWNLEIYLCI